MEDWAERVRLYEYEYAMQNLAKGHDLNVVMEVMATRISKKLMHPIISAIKNLKI